MSYLVRVVGPAGRVSYLCRGKKVGVLDATWYSHPSNALVAALAYKRKTSGQNILIDVVNTKKMKS